MRAMHKQRGVVLIIGLMMLVLLTLMAVAALRLGGTNFTVVNNQQTRAEAIRSADQVIDQIVKNQQVDLVNGTNLFGTGSNTVRIKINGEPANATDYDYTVVVAPPLCVKRQVIPQASLDFAKPDDLGRSRSVDQAALGVEGAGGGDSLCSTVVWDVTATASDVFQQNNVFVVQGIGQRVATTKVGLVCD
jgi:Tfp pilus assembly protein PilX